MPSTDSLGTSMMLSPNIQTAVYGEANIARYLSRLINPSYDSMDIISATEIDNWLDLATQIIHGNNKERAAVLRTLNARLGKCSWLVGSELSLADIMLWSALQQNKMTQAVPSNVKKWLEACNQQTTFKRAAQIAAQL
jgi:aminoacyl tRNA synthase complex-interacting multifunctional protein 2